LEKKTLGRLRASQRSTGTLCSSGAPEKKKKRKKNHKTKKKKKTKTNNTTHPQKTAIRGNNQPPPPNQPQKNKKPPPQTAAGAFETLGVRPHTAVVALLKKLWNRCGVVNEQVLRAKGEGNWIGSTAKLQKTP